MHPDRGLDVVVSRHLRALPRYFVANAPQETPFAYWKTGIYHILASWRVPDIEGLASRRIDELVEGAADKVWKLWPDKPYKVCYCEDPWGTIIERRHAEVSSHPYVMAWSNEAVPRHGVEHPVRRQRGGRPPGPQLRRLQRRTGQ